MNLTDERLNKTVIGGPGIKGLEGELSMEKTVLEYFEEILGGPTSKALTGYQKQAIDAAAELFSVCPFDRLCELVQAENDGRLVMLPCKVGTPVYRIGAGVCKWREIDRCNDYCSGYEYEDCWEGGLEVLKEKSCFEMLGKVGKTVFLTREEAEAALEAQKGGAE